MRDLLVIAFILAIPTLVVLGHDAYMAYNNTHLEVADRFYPSDLGWLWINYHPSSYNMALSNADAEIWNNFIDPLLQLSAVYVAIAPLVVFCVIVLFLKAFGFGPFEGQGWLAIRIKDKNSLKRKVKKGDVRFGAKKTDKVKRAKYKRK